jgi:4-amino-4-deoxy-L-arabinose transferase-like glycosyltransferase
MIHQSRAHAIQQRLSSWARERIPELILFAIGLALHVSLLGFQVQQGYDYVWHKPYVHWFAEHPWQLPPCSLTPEIYHPPLYYWWAGRAVALGLSDQQLGIFSIACGVARLALLWLGLELCVPNKLARRVALALAVVLPASVHLDGMMTSEALNNLLAVTAMLLVVAVWRTTRTRARLGWATALGLTLGLSLLTKVSGFVLVFVVAAVAVAEWALRREGGWRQRARRVAPWALAVLLAGGLSSWYFVDNVRSYGKVTLDACDCGNPWFRPDVAAFRRTPYLQRRPLTYFVRWNNDIYLMSPYYPTAVRRGSAFFPALVASTFVDAYGYRYARLARPGEATVLPDGRPLRRSVFLLSCVSAFGGSLIALATAAAWFVTVFRCARRRDGLALALLMVPLVAVLGQAHYAMLYPNQIGPVKGIYMQFAAAPMFALFGLAVAALWERERWRALAVVELLALGTVAVYTFFCRFT